MVDEGERRLHRARRITGSAEIRGLFQRGKRSRTAHLDVFDSPSPARFCRAGVVVPKHRHTAVQRNLLKRRLRELVRTEVLRGLADCGLRLDVLVRARREAYDVGFGALRDELTEWVAARCSRAR